MNYCLKIQLLSPALPGAGEGWASQVDTDVVYDDLGLPYIPAKRIKGILKEVALDLLKSGHLLEFKNDSKSHDIIDKVFGKIGDEQSANLSISNARIKDYQNCRDWLKWAEKESKMFSVDRVINAFTQIRQQTAIEMDTAKKDSLRVLRLLNPGLCFESEMSLAVYDENYEKILVYCSLVMRNMGLNRNRGMGKIKCNLYKENDNLSEKLLNQLKSGGGQNE